MAAASTAGRAPVRLAGISFLVLRALSALGALVNGFALTYGFARILEPSIFALFILVGNIGMSLWLFDLGLGRVLYVRLRKRHLSDALRKDRILRLQAASVVVLYTLLVIAGALAALLLGRSSGHRMALAMFFAFSAFNLPWFALRQVSAAVDRFVAFETLDAVRRASHVGLIVALPFGLPLQVCFLAGNAIWAAILVTAAVALMRAGGMAMGSPIALAKALLAFLGRNRRNLLWSAGYVGSEFYIYTYPPLLIPLVYGLGPTAIAFDAAYKVFRGTNVLLAAACEVAAPWQTRAHAAQDRRRMVAATAIAALLSFVPAAGVCALLLLAGDRLFALLLGGAAVVPRELTLLTAAMVAANWIQTVSNFALLYTGFFAAIARVALVMAVLLSLPALYDVLARPNLVGFTAFYAAIYAMGALAYLALAVRLPLRVGRIATEPALVETASP